MATTNQKNWTAAQRSWTETKERSIGILTERFANATARAAAISEILTAETYLAYFRDITADAAKPEEALLNWAIRRGELWETCQG